MSGRIGRLRRSAALRSAGGGLGKVFGYATSMVLLAAASLVSIPAMVAASGPRALAAIVTGQAIGAVGAVLIGYGWVVTGPAEIARGDRRRQLAEYVRSVGVRLALFLPVAGAAAGLATLVARDEPWLAALGAISAASVGLRANWYFVGLSRPFLLLFLETVPRVGGTVIGIVLMYRGAEAQAGLWGQFAGMVAGFAASSVWIAMGGSRESGWWKPRVSVFKVLRAQFHGVATSAVASLDSALPIVIVGLVAVPAQPGFAMLDKFQKQVNAALTAYVSVVQGWVPRAPGSQIHARIRQALIASGALAALLALAIALLGRPVVEWLGNGQIPVTSLAVALMGAIVAAAMFSMVLTSACLVAIGKLPYMARVTALGSVVGLGLVALLGSRFGIEGAQLGILTGLAVRISLGLRAARQVALEAAR